MRDLKHPILCKTFRVNCPVCKKWREVIQRYKALPKVICEDCKVRRLRAYQRERARNAKRIH